MGRRKITIQQITDPKLRNITYNKRKNGLIKKAAEIALLCDINLLLVFEDLNGTLVQFSRNPIKNIANFPKECNFKRVLELTSEDYPNFSRIKRHKKKNDTPLEEGLRTPISTSSKASRSYVDMMSESGSHVSKEDLFTSDSESSLDYGMDMMSESPYSTFSESGFDITPAADLMQQVLPTHKAVKTRMLTDPRMANQKETKNKLNLRLNIPKAEDSIKGALGADSKGNKKRGPPSSLKQNSTQKNYIRKSHFESNKSIEKKTDMTPSPYTMMNGNMHMNAGFNMAAMNNNMNNNNMGMGMNMNMGGYQNLFSNNRPLNLMTSPPKDFFNQQGFGQMKQMNMMGGDDENYGGPSSFPEFSPFATGGYQMVGTTPPSLKQDQIRINPDDPYATEKIGNYLSHPGRSPPQQQHVFTFQPNDMRGLVENNMGFSAGGYGLGMENDHNSSKKNNSFWEYQLNDKNTYGKIEHGLSSGGGLSGNRPSFEGYAFGSNNNNNNNNDQIDWSEQFRRMKMS